MKVGMAVNVEAFSHIMTMMMTLFEDYLLFRILFETENTRYATALVTKTPIRPDKPTLSRAFSRPDIP